MTRLERVQADFRTLSLTTGCHPMKLLRSRLPDLRTAAELAGMKSGDRVRVGGAVITRQRPGTAKGFLLLSPWRMKPAMPMPSSGRRSSSGFAS